MTNKKQAGNHYARLRSELAAALGYDVDALNAAQEMRLDNAVALRLVSDGLRAKLVRGEDVDHKELLAVTEGLQRLLPDEPRPAPDQDSHLKRVARAKVHLRKHIIGWIEAENAERIERGLKGLQPSLAEAQQRVDDLEMEVRAYKAFINTKGLLSAYDAFLDSLPDNDQVFDPTREAKTYQPHPMPKLPPIARVFTDCLNLPPMDEQS